MLFKNSLKNNFVTIDLENKAHYAHGVFMWFMLFVGYFLFSSNWFIFNKLEGSSGSGWSSTLASCLPEIVKKSFGYVIPFARAAASLSAAYILNKFTHRYSVLIGLLMNAFAFFLVFSPNFAFVVIGRIIMGFGGSLIIIYIQPIINKFFNSKKKGLFSTLSALSYPISSIVLNLLFLISSLNTFLVTNWKITAALFGALTFIPLILYFFLGLNFETNSKDKRISYKEIIKEKSTKDWIFCYTSLLFVSIAISYVVSKIFVELVPGLKGTITFLDWESLYICCFYFGCAFGMSLGKFNMKKMQRTTVIRWAAGLCLAFWFLIISFLGLAVLTKQYLLFSILIFFSVFWATFFGMGFQAVFFHIPHEYPDNNPEKLTIFFSILWGSAYFIYGIFAIIFAGFQQLGLNWVNLIIITLWMFIYFRYSLKIEEPKKDWKKFSLENID